MKIIISALLVLLSHLSFSQSKMELELNQAYRDISFEKTSSIMYTINLEAKHIYEFRCIQDGIDVVIYLKDSTGKILAEMDSPNGSHGPEVFEYTTTYKGDFISEKITNSHINKTAQKYGDEHEKELWQLLKSEMCAEESINWLYNGGDVKDKPADLGYYMGYKIAESYYNNASDKIKAISEIIEMNDPLRFLIDSKYEMKFKN